MQAVTSCPLQCTAQSPDGCAQRFQCAHGCPVCEQPPPSAACYGYRRVEPLQLACSRRTWSPGRMRISTRFYSISAS